MPRAGRVGDTAERSSDAGSNHAAKGAAGEGSPDVFIDGRAALRVEDPGEKSDCCAKDGWQASAGSSGVFINGKPAFRYGDETTHCGGKGELAEGSPDVVIGDRKPGTPKERPHDKVSTIDVKDGVGRPVHDVTVTVFCPHHKHDDKTVDGGTSVDGICTGTTVTVHKKLQHGAWDPNASPRAGAHHSTHKVEPKPPAAPAPPPAPSSGGAPVAPPSPPPIEPVAPKPPKLVVHAPAPAGTPRDVHAVHIPKPIGDTSIVLPTVHNWVELVYRAFGHEIPTGPMDLALLGVREASLSGVVKQPENTLEKEADAGDLTDVDFTREKRANTYNDLLFCVWTDTTVNKRQHVEVFECTIDASPGIGDLHLPVLLEGALFHGRPGSYDSPHFPGTNIALHLSNGAPAPKSPESGTAKGVIALAQTQRGITESPAGSNLQKYGKWYGTDGVYWCAQFVSWVMAHAGMPLIHYEYCPTGADEFESGAWGKWIAGPGHAEPGDVVFYQFGGPGTDSDHTGIVVSDDGGSITTIEGNTTAPGGSGSQSNGGGVFLKSRPKDDLIKGFGRPRYPDAPTEPLPVIRWGNEISKVNLKSARDSTMLHHHYFKQDKAGHEHPDETAERYRRFMHLYNGAKNKTHIPYLIGSSRYLKTYSQWVSWIDENPGVTPNPKSVVAMSGLESPAGLKYHYLPSFMSKEYADRVLKKVHDMHDRHKAAELKASLEHALFKLSI